MGFRMYVQKVYIHVTMLATAACSFATHTQL